ncbi:unnamed protein product [Heterobilharzia americana]|nr:unnamed protein product [Heterobilharzia americana]
MTETAHTSDSEMDDPNKITDAASCLDYLKRREVFLYKMMNDPSHKAMLYFLEVLMNSDSPITVDQLAARFSHKSFSIEMREACGGGSADGLREFLLRYPSLFNVKPNGQVTSVAIELPGLDSNFDSLSDQESCSMKENCQKSINDNLSDNSTSFRNHPANTSAYSSKTCPVTSLQKDYSYNNNNNNRFQTNSASCLSLTSSQSVTSLNGSLNCAQSSIDHIFGRKKPSSNFINNNNVTTNNTTNDNNNNPTVRGLSSTNPSTVRTKSSNIYQPPQLRNLEHTSQMVVTPTCELCSSNTTNHRNNNSNNNSMPVNHHEISTMPSGTCVHCPLLELTCHHTHHCTTAHHHTSTHCHCTSTPLVPPTTPSFHHYHHPVHHIPAQTTLRSPPILLPNCYTLPPMEKLLLEKRWVPIKSLAGHLSQATPEVRAIVGPQLEFRRFLLKHPHVFEVQGDLVSVKDPFSGGFALKRSRDRLSAVHASHSSTNISNTTQGYLPRNISYERNPRPKSLILPNMMNFGHLSNFSDLSSYYTPSSIQRSSNTSNYHRRSAHFIIDSSVNNPPIKSIIQSESFNSAPTTPTSSNPILCNANRGNQTEKSIVEKLTNNTNNHNHHNGVSSSTITTEYDTSILTNSLPSITSNTTVNSLSLTMSANEYRAIMFLRKVLDKQGGAIGQTGLSLHDLMQFLSNKAPETVQTTIGWTKIELEEFLCEHKLFFELKSIDPDSSLHHSSSHNNNNNNNNNNIDDVQNEVKQNQLMNKSKLEENITVCNRRLNRMINIIITASRLNDLNSVRTLTNRCGRIFHVAKLWGIIDLGKHEHVFFDKSIFRHVDDLQKHFKVDELLYFNAVLAPKESRAKWRATHVWKECDRENVEKFGALSRMNTMHMKKVNISNGHRNTLHSTHSSYELDTERRNGVYQNYKNTKFRSRDIGISTMNDTGNIGENNSNIADGDDTEVEEEIEDYVVENSTCKDKELSRSHQNHHLDNDSDSEYGLDGDEEVDETEEPLISPIAHEEGLHLPIDIKFIADEVEEEMERVINIHLKSSNNKDETRNLPNSKSSCFEVCDSSHSAELSHQTHSEPCRIKNNNSKTSNTHERHYSLVTSSTGQTELIRHRTNLSSKDDSGTSSSLSEMNAVSIAVQTVSTGDIMATQLYHDNKQ